MHEIENQDGSHTFLKDRTILIVDDNAVNIFALTSIIEDYVKKVYTCENGKDALALIKKQKDITVVLMDMMMPVMSGYEAIQEIRALETSDKLCILAVTANAMLGDREKCLESGADEYISKPIDIEDLFAKLQVLLNP